LIPQSTAPIGTAAYARARASSWPMEEANRGRQPGDLPFELVEREGMAQWGGAANVTSDLADDKVLGFLGTIDGAEAHVALRVHASRPKIVMINTSDPDPSLTETMIPWLIRVFPDQRLEEAKLAELIVHRFGCRRIAILREGDRYGASRGAFLHGLRPTPGLPCGAGTALQTRRIRHPPPDRCRSKTPNRTPIFLHRRAGRYRPGSRSSFARRVSRLGSSQPNF